MTTETMWNLFYETGLPECYTLYCNLLQEEEIERANQESKTA